MKPVRSGAGALLVFVATLTALAASSRSTSSLSEARPVLVMAAACFYSMGFLVFSGVWAFLTCVSQRRGAHGGRVSFVRRFRVGMLSLAGLLTPLSVGTDVLRSMLGRKYLGLGYAPTASASIIARESKLHVSVVLLAMVAATTGIGTEESRGPLLAAFAGLLALALLLVAFRSDVAKGLLRSPGIGRVADSSRALTQQLQWRGRGAIYVLFAAGFAAEWEGLRLCFQSLGVPAEPIVTLAAYGVLHFLSRLPVPPVGVGVVETGGFGWLLANQVPVEQAGAIVILWGCLRVAVPYLLAAASFATFVSDARGPAHLA